LLNGVATVRGFCHQRHIRLNPDETGDSLPHEWMVIDCENADLRASAAHRADLQCALE
jgi:hypothetical protein